MHKIIPRYYHFIDNLNIEKIKKFNHNIGLIYRNYTTQPKLNQVIDFRNHCKRNKIIFIISKYYNIAVNCKLDGIYIPSFDKDKLYINDMYLKKFIIIGSAHNLKEIKEKKNQKIQQLMISPVFKNKNNRPSLGLYRYNLLKNFAQIPTIPLGGINNKNIKLLKMFKEYKFAAINFFKS